MLFHGILGSERMWGRVIPLLTDSFDVIAPTALGHRGGRPLTTRPGSMTHVIDDMERTMDDLGLEVAHLAGNSMGGWIAIELARRGRALSVCALSPAGLWAPGVDSPGRRRAVRVLSRTVTDARRGRRLLPIGAPVPLVRRWALRAIAVHGQRVPGSEVIGMTDDLLACQLIDDLKVRDEWLGPLETLPCPITVAWSEKDKVVPMTSSLPIARAALAQASFVTLPGVGHVPMCDDPVLTAQTIRAAAGRAGEPA